MGCDPTSPPVRPWPLEPLCVCVFSLRTFNKNWDLLKTCLRVMVCFAVEFLGAYLDAKIPCKFKNNETQLLGHRILLHVELIPLVRVGGGRSASPPSSPQVVPICWYRGDAGVRTKSWALLAVAKRGGPCGGVGRRSYSHPWLQLLVAAWARLPGRRLAGSPQSGKSPEVQGAAGVFWTTGPWAASGTAHSACGCLTQLPSIAVLWTGFP